MAQIAIHPAVDKGLKPAAKDFAGGTLRCLCTSDPVEVVITGQCAHNHVCGCTQCWKPEGALFAQIAVAPRDKVRVSKNGDKLKIINPNALIIRHACRACGVHMQGPVERPNHPFTGLVFIHTERAAEQGWEPPDLRRVRVVDHRVRHASPIRWLPCARASMSSGCRPTTACRPR